MPTAIVASKGQVTIPKKIREVLRIGRGDRIEFVVDEEGRVSVKAGRNDIRDLKGLLHRLGRRAVTLAAMENAIVSRR
jgi:antitoxin PrlF